MKSENKNKSSRIKRRKLTNCRKHSLMLIQIASSWETNRTKCNRWSRGVHLKCLNSNRLTRWAVSWLRNCKEKLTSTRKNFIWWTDPSTLPLLRRSRTATMLLWMKDTETFRTRKFSQMNSLNSLMSNQCHHIIHHFSNWVLNSTMSTLHTRWDSNSRYLKFQSTSPHTK